MERKKGPKAGEDQKMHDYAAELTEDKGKLRDFFLLHCDNQ